jgi:PAS domain S-box-containing protein
MVLRVLDSVEDSVVVIDAWGRIVLVNPAAEQLFGYDSAQVVGVTADLLVPRMARAVRQLCSQLEQDGVQRGSGVELGGLDAQGTQFPVRVRLMVVRGGREMLVLATVRDLSERRAAAGLAWELECELRESRESVSAVLRAVTDRAIVLADEQGRITAVNRATERLLGYRVTELLGQPAEVLSDPEQILVAARELGLDPQQDPLLEVSRSGLPNSQEWIFRTKDGQARQVSLRVNAVGTPRDPSGFVFVAQDLTVSWQPVTAGQPRSDRLLWELDDAPTRAMRWQMGGSGCGRR